MPKQKRKVKFDHDDTEDQEAVVVARVPTIIHKWATIPYHLPLILVGMFKFGLTSHVKQTLVKGYISLICLQAVHSYILYINTVDFPDSSSGKKHRKKNKDNLVLLIASSLVLPVLMSPAVLAILVLLGAPVSSHVIETYLLAAHLSTVVATPLLVTFKLNFANFVSVFKSPDLFCVVCHHQTLSSGLLALVGTWIGVLPIPLDWDRPWQAWPVTLVVGTYIGFFGGSVINLAL
ncbi:Glycosylphosphatidylinositol (GPI) anchor assembly protein [Yamadazyma tenuis]|uniref:Glycosylphosphatidylinositol anchor biosynthesis protein 11 n=1 Tax=Candida tenuis (strain ATCC 10573 / BCRC 21748 / CBS 615 / JCM 9827 / NBRC 10315 / NRRL Y-1498 / VKM Y-70) TaxID=590646 RepID=G3BAZ1_CANTC|nr:uncharacterized protein CANTEDRAFT_98701 [Yamadazyma tenuis ATCC 10573]EGV61486.1 hypothetical protein CANTEDRAFT_98701 [Yamadazyma tenuis ATCC 10573]WEJ92702.1 Glycosylphosphatidylinositol (GPI) anchor assembly protein [Yamadazyma tenuis]